MDRYRATYPRDDASHADGDSAFVGVNSKLSPEKLDAGLVRDAVNKVFRDGVASTRAGVITPIYHNPRLNPIALDDLDFLVITVTWSPANGDGLRLVLVGHEHESLDTINETWTTDTAIGSGASYILMTPAAASQPGAPGLWGFLWDITLARGNFNFAKITLEISALFATVFDGFLTVTYQGYVGGTMALDGRNQWANTGGTAGTPTTRTLRAGAVLALRAQLTMYAGSRRALLLEPGGLVQTYGLGVQAGTDGREWLLLARADGIWRMRDGLPPQRFDTPEPITAECSFVQANNRVYLFRGETLVQWVWDGSTSGTWAPVSQLDPGDTSKPIPFAITAEVVGDRLLIPHGRDTVDFTDLLDAEHFDPLLSERINRGSNDSLIRLYPYANNAVLAFKSRSIYLLQGVSGDLSEVTLTDISRAIGCVARKSVTQVGADIWFLSHAGVYRVSQVLQDRIQTDPVPISDPILPFFRDRVNWRAIASAAACTLGEYYYLALPIDGSATNNAVLVYNTSSQHWEGHHTYPAGATISEWITTDYNGEKRLFAADHPRGYVYLMHEDIVDRIDAVEIPIEDLLLTRGYLVGSEDTKAFTRLELSLATWNPEYSVHVQTGDVVAALVTDRTKDRTKSKTYGAPAYDATNANDDHDDPRREDYSVVMPPLLLSSSNGFTVWSGIDFDRLQTFTERFPCPRNSRGRWASVEVTSTRGRCNVLAAQIEARQSGRTTRTE